MATPWPRAQLRWARTTWCGPELAAAEARADQVARPDLLDRQGRAVRHRHPGAADQALVVVADHREVAVALRDQLHQHVLGVVGVLVLVDEHVAEAVAPPLARLLVGLQQQDDLADQVVEVQAARALEN
jgi:hypothetical protein